MIGARSAIWKIVRGRWTPLEGVQIFERNMERWKMRVDALVAYVKVSN